ncbi:MAG: phenylalanine--tRNA ligase subunit beta [Dehalococcoidales bacterium]
MKVPIKWLRDYVAISLPLAELAQRLVMAGTEVKGLQVVGDRWRAIVVGQIAAVKPHPNADRLRLVTVDLGGRQQTVVSGAPNLRLGDRVAFARVGAELIDGHSGQRVILESAKIRGVVSSGMVCSEKELGISDSYEGIMVLPPEAPVGAELADFLGETIFDLEVTPNRPDLLSVIGVAREVAALTGKSVSLPELTYEASGAPIEGQVSVEIAAPDLCPRYCASLISGIEVAESPEWLQQRLLASGMRPINNIVDATNYVMLEHGQPLHAFDYQKIKGKKIIVRRANSGEVMVSLDGEERTLSGDMLVIADAGRAIAVAGVMGGLNSEVSQGTTSILVESASFKPASIHYTSGRLRLVSEASMRFARAISPELTLPAIKRATQLILQLAGGRAARGLIDVYPGEQPRQPILLSADGVKRLLGVEFSPQQIAGTLTSLGFELKIASSSSEFLVTAPYWRSDIHLEVDLIEEVARVAGYDKIPAAMPGRSLPRQEPEPILGLKKRLRQGLIGYGFQEVITYSLTGKEVLEKVLEPHPAPLRVANPMTAEQEYLRPSLRGGLLAALAANMRHEEGAIRLFEIGRVYLPRHNELPDEPEVLCGLLADSGLERSWHGRMEPLDFFDAKGLLEGLLAQLGVPASFEEGSDGGLYPGRQAAVVVGGDRVGVVGELHPGVAEAFEISGAVYLFEMNLARLLPHTLGYGVFQPIARFPAVVRDVALVVDAKVSHRQVLDIIKGFPLVSEAALFDVYSGRQVPAGKKSLAYRLTYRSADHTLTDKEADRVQQQLLAKLSAELGASLRA